MHLVITLDGVTRDYHVDTDDIINKDWNSEVADMLDTVEKAENV